MISITEGAQEKIRSIIQTRRPEVTGLRIGYEAKGRYSMALVDDMPPDDSGEVKLTFDGFDVVMDSVSAEKMDEASIDYIETASESGFKIDNPWDNRPAAPRPESAPTEEAARALYDKVQSLLETDINPGIASHGGHVDLIDVKGTSVYIEMAGGCQGCGMASVTLKHGIERVLRDALPEIGEILDVTDHAGGSNPYYASTAK